MTKIQDFETNHYDRITVIDHNLTGKRLLTASADHRVKVYERATLDSEPVLKDTWTAHNADIRDAKWFHPTLGTHLATISNDLTLKIWAHDPSQAPNSGRTFRRLTTISSQSGVPFVSLSIKHLAPASTYLAVIDRIGWLTIFTTASPDSFSDWAQVTRINVVDGGPPPRTTETSFSVCFDQNVNPVPYILNLPSSTPNILSFAVSALDVLKIYRSSPHAASVFQEAARSPIHPSLIRSISWANGNIRGYDILATGSADGTISIFDLHTSSAPSSSSDTTQTSTGGVSTSMPKSRPPPQSSLTTAIAGQSHSQAHQSRTSSISNPQPPSNTTSTSSVPHGPFTHTLLSTAPLPSHPHHRDCLAVQFDPTGSLLASMDADGQTFYWKRSVIGYDDFDEAADMDDDDDDDDAERRSRAGQHGADGGIEAAGAYGKEAGRWVIFAMEEEGGSEDEGVEDSADGDGGADVIGERNAGDGTY